ncbi:hypothetical protein FA13DRAFT_233590 [Coprinellus micaceus]|uniref:Secreted protein n=1 Tax=Coprinellus micaceus TaxID=71717 RepID=A0A4Y7TFK0_COPMI|nr:hypothetical protein FA13DRAFT_233590 [Coprinellus micaceus]
MVRTHSQLALLLVVALQVTAQTLTVTNSGVIGTGCQPGTAQASVKNGVVSIEASNFIASAGPGVSYSSGRKNCQATLTVSVPSGYQFGFAETKLPAQVKTDSGVQVSARSEYYFQGELTKDQDTSTVPAGSSGTVTLVNSYGPSAWSSCGGSSIVNINTSLRASNANNRGGSGSIRLKGNLNTEVVWRKC